MNGGETSVLARMRVAHGSLGAGLYAAALSLVTLAVLGLVGLLSHPGPTSSRVPCPWH